jgi:hypothetical protein
VSILPQSSQISSSESASFVTSSRRPGSAGASFRNTPKRSGVAGQVGRFFLQSAARDLVPRERVSLCLRRLVPTRPLVDLFYAPASSSAHYGGLQVCGSVWLCPVCSAKISERRRVELTTGVNNWYAQQGERRILLVTFTLSHQKQDNLSTVLRALKKARSLLVSGRWAASFAAEHSIVGTIRSLEVTYGENGWHPHLHVLYFFDREVSIIKFEESIKARWSACVAAAGSYASWQYGCDVRFSDKEVAKYVAKFGKDPEWKDTDKELSSSRWSIAHEVTKGPAKLARSGGSTPLQLLQDYASGSVEAGRLWLQYAVNFKGERQLWFSQGLRDLLGLVAEKTDQELAVEQDEIAILLAQLTTEQWRVVLENEARGQLLEVAAAGDGAAVWEFLKSFGIEQIWLYVDHSARGD